MPSLSSRERASLPDNAFAYVDSKGRRRLPIHDVSHVRNALARFSQVRFESEEARVVARDRLLKAARRHGIVPVGFITGQLQVHHKRAAAARLVIELARIRTSNQLEAELRKALDDESLQLLSLGPGEAVPTVSKGCVTMVEVDNHRAALVHREGALADPDISEALMAAMAFVLERERLDREVRTPARAATLPTGVVTHMLTDIEGSTPLLIRLGPDYGALLTEVRRVIRDAVVAAGGTEVDARADEFQAVFTDAAAAVRAAVGFQRVLSSRRWPAVEVRVRAGVHTGEIDLVDGDYVGLSIHVAARVCSAAYGGQILTTAASVDAAGVVPGVEFRSLGRHRLAGLAEPETLFQVLAQGIDEDFPPPRS